jgi:hypothetical protein
MGLEGSSHDPAEIRTDHIPNTSLQRDRYASLLRVLYFLNCRSAYLLDTFLAISEIVQY